MITSNVIHRVFNIRVGSALGTCFTVDVEGRQYVVTASHVLNQWDGVSPLEIRCKGSWHPVVWQLTGHSPSGADVSVLAPPSPLSPNYTMLATNEGITYGQEVFFLGFPYGLTGLPYGLNKQVDAANRYYPMPLVKRATLSGWDQMNDSEVMLLDGHNNPGFSGGPVVFKSGNSKEFRVAGVVSGYHWRDHPILEGAKTTPYTYQYNTGIIVAYSIQRAVEIIQANSTGP